MAKMFDVCAVSKYTDSNGNQQNIFNRIGIAFENTKDNKRSIGVKMNVITMCKDFVLFERDEKEGSGNQPEPDDEIPF